MWPQCSHCISAVKSLPSSLMIWSIFIWMLWHNNRIEPTRDYAFSLSFRSFVVSCHQPRVAHAERYAARACAVGGVSGFQPSSRRCPLGIRLFLPADGALRLWCWRCDLRRRAWLPMPPVTAGSLLFFCFERHRARHNKSPEPMTAVSSADIRSRTMKRHSARLCFRTQSWLKSGR